MSGAPIGWHKHAAKRCFLFFERVGNWVVQTCPQGMFLIVLKGQGLDFLSSSQTVPFNNLSKSFCSHQVPNNSHQIPLVFINNPSKSFCSHQVPKKSLLFPSVTCQNPFVFIKFPSNSFYFHQVPENVPMPIKCVTGIIDQDKKQRSIFCSPLNPKLQIMPKIPFLQIMEMEDEYNVNDMSCFRTQMRNSLHYYHSHGFIQLCQ